MASGEIDEVWDVERRGGGGEDVGVVFSGA